MYLKDQRSGDRRAQRAIAFVHTDRRAILHIAPQDQVGERVLQLAVDRALLWWCVIGGVIRAHARGRFFNLFDLVNQIE